MAETLASHSDTAKQIISGWGRWSPILMRKLGIFIVINFLYIKIQSIFMITLRKQDRYFTEITHFHQLDGTVSHTIAD